MNINKIIIILLVILGGSFLYLNDRVEKNVESNGISLDSNEITESTDCVPTFLDGGGPYYQANSPLREKIAPDDNSGEPLIVEGRILFNDCETPVLGSILDIWQANESGNYEDEWYRGQVQVDNEGNYRFETVVPEGYGSGTGYRPPHIHFKVHLDGRELITSQMFFPEARGRDGFEDAYIMSLEENTNDPGNKIYYGSHNIILPTTPEDL